MDGAHSIADYVRWRGDLSFVHSPFNLVDNLVLCKLAYYDLAALPEVAGEEGLSVQACAERLGDAACMKGSPTPDDFLVTCAASERFGGLTVRSYVDLDPARDGTQFCAMEFVLGKNLSYLAFRGTDNTLLGWREDFEIGYRPVAAQLRALAYVRELLRRDRSYFVGGHSKGANLALYATALLGDSLLGRVRKVFLNDGPGLCHEVVPVRFSEAFLRKAVRVLPAYSVFGRLFEAVSIPKVIVANRVDGLLAHELLNWEIRDGKLAYAKAHHPASDRVAQVFSEWMDNVGPAEREAFVDGLFESLAAGGASHVTELGARGIEGVEDVLSAFVSTESGAKRALARLPMSMALGNVFAKMRDVGFFRWALGDDLAHNVELVMLGLAFLLARDEALLGLVSLLFLGVVTLLVAETALRARGREAGLKGERWRVNACIAASVLFITTLVKDDALFVYGSACLGIMLTAMAAFYANQMRDVRVGPGARGLSGLAALLLAACAVLVLVAPVESMDALAAVVGVLFVAAGVLGAALVLAGRRRGA